MKKLLKWFTLVEILIVIVIIGILIWALVPRMQSAQWRARDVARKNDLSQLQSAIVTSYSDRWEWPEATTCALSWTTHGCAIAENSNVGNRVIAAWLNWVPTDPIKWNNVAFQKDATINSWYWYAVAMKNWVKDAWFILMAHTEVEWWSNWVECSGSNDVSHGYLPDSTDLKDIIPCSKLTSTGAGGCAVHTWNECFYEDTTQLRYILVY